MYKIDKNIPVPSYGRTIAPKYPFDLMDVGDSFAVPFNHQAKGKKGCADAVKTQNRLAAAVTKRKQKSKLQGNPEQYTTRRMDDNCYRVWRVA